MSAELVYLPTNFCTLKEVTVHFLAVDAAPQTPMTVQELPRKTNTQENNLMTSLTKQSAKRASQYRLPPAAP